MAAKITAMSTVGYSAIWSEKGMTPAAFGPSASPSNPAVMLAGTRSICQSPTFALTSVPISNNKEMKPRSTRRAYASNSILSFFPAAPRDPAIACFEPVP